MNSNLDTLYNVINGNLDDTNIITGANINPLKIAGAAATLSTAQTIAGQKTFSQPIVLGENTTPTTPPPAGYHFLYIKADGSLYRMDSNGTETPIGANRAACRLTNSAGINVPNAAWTPLTWDTEAFDTDSMHNPNSNSSRITFNTAGVYVITYNGEFGSNGGGFRRAAFAINGVREVQTPPLTPTGDNYVAMNLSVVRNFAVGDYIEVYVYQNAGGGISYDAARSGEIISQFAAQYLSLGQ